jgi:hypothetical protein
MKPSMMRTIFIVLALACLGSRVAPASALVLGVLTFGTHADDHAHSVTLVQDDDHVDVVFAHAEPANDAAHQHDDPAASGSDASHVLHLTQDDAATTITRRDPVPTTHVMDLRVAYLPRLESTSRLIQPATQHVRRLNPSKTVVLRV